MKFWITVLLMLVAAEVQAAPIGPYSIWVEAPSHATPVYFSGVIGIDAHSEIVPGGLLAEVKQAFLNLDANLKSAGLNKSHIIKTTVFLANMADFAAMNELYAAYFTDDVKPARSCVAVKDLPKGSLFEIEVLAYRPIFNSEL